MGLFTSGPRGLVDLPTIRDTLRCGIDALKLRGVVGFSRTTGQNGIGPAQSLKPGPHARWNHHERVKVYSQHKLHHLAACHRCWPLVIQHEPDAAEDTRVIPGCSAVVFPRFDDSRTDRGKVDFSEML